MVEVGMYITIDLIEQKNKIYLVKGVDKEFIYLTNISELGKRDEPNTYSIEPREEAKIVRPFWVQSGDILTLSKPDAYGTMLTIWYQVEKLTFTLITKQPQAHLRNIQTDGAKGHLKIVNLIEIETYKLEDGYKS